MALGRTSQEFWQEADSLPASQQASFADWLEDKQIPVDAPVHALERAMRDWRNDQRWHARRAGLHVPPREGDQPRMRASEPATAEWQDVTERRGRSEYWRYALLRDGNIQAKVEQRGYASGNPGFVATVALGTGKVVELYDTRVGAREPFSSIEEAKRGVARGTVSAKGKRSGSNGRATMARPAAKKSTRRRGKMFKAMTR